MIVSSKLPSNSLSSVHFHKHFFSTHPFPRTVVGSPGETALNETWSFLLLPQLGKLIACVYLPRAEPTKGKPNQTKPESLIRWDGWTWGGEDSVWALIPWTPRNASDGMVTIGKLLREPEIMSHGGDLWEWKTLAWRRKDLGNWAELSWLPIPGSVWWGRPRVHCDGGWVQEKWLGFQMEGPP